MARLTTTFLIAASIVAMAGCAKKPPAEIPPPPGNSGPVSQGDSSIVPGSRADFERSVTSNTIHFDLDKYDINSEARAVLDSQAAWLTKYPNVPISLEGHCDERGTREYNLALGDRRANSAKNYLASRGVNPARISTISYGKERPIALGSDEAAWAQNRRAVTIVLN
ncbi:peptidoglycan-associated lipoprotein Pal [Sphingomonas sp. H39-1-10]|uniref:peptidoglycan-associated lipoprotein Pal n=1 Tax=Sphingomonas TaxID=13687 RepID=UPI0008829FD6|nr:MULTISPECIES: peptidoglycan-associated lipoprotein Pal [Sphingomonas]MDF0486803.1 peptidoglycan-associated lipoprotein Pal [Sphingomonas pollutisoli]SDA35130.1 peptidoglycan-associated lipoprotein [Sphingomonas sp. NFR15]